MILFCCYALFVTSPKACPLQCRLHPVPVVNPTPWSMHVDNLGAGLILIYVYVCMYIYIYIYICINNDNIHAIDIMTYNII